MANTFYKTFNHSCSSDKNIRLKWCNGYWDLEKLNITICVESIDEENGSPFEFLAERGEPFVIIREEKTGAKTYAKGFSNFHGAIDYLIENLDEIEKMQGIPYPSVETDSKEEKPHITQCEWCNTGGSIYCFIGTLSDDTYFMTDGDNFDTRILSVYPSFQWENIWYVEEQEKYLIRDLDTEKDGPQFILDIFDFLRKSGDKNVDFIKWIEDEAKELKGKNNWR